MKIKSFLLAGLMIIIASSCGVNDLEERLDKIENALGTNEPFTVNFSTKNSQDLDVIEKETFLFKSKGYNDYMELYSDGTIYVYIERFSDVDWNEGGWIEFTYDPSTEEVTNTRAGMYFYNSFGDWNSRYFSESNYTENTVDLTVKSINFETGAIDVSVSASTTANSNNNLYSGKAMTCTFKFKGKLEAYDYSSNNNQ